MRKPKFGRTDLERFLFHTKWLPSGCVVWTGALKSNGYVQFSTGSEVDGTVARFYAHRWIYEQLVGPIPDGLVIDHLCRVRHCMNPQHLEPVTMRENLYRGESPSTHNAVKTHCYRGHALRGENVATYAGKRICRICNRMLQKAQYQRRVSQLRRGEPLKIPKP